MRATEPSSVSRASRPATSPDRARLIFLSIDALGGVVSFLSLVFEPPIDALAAVNCASSSCKPTDRADLSVVAAELAIFALVPVLNSGKDVATLHEGLLVKAELERSDGTALRARQHDDRPIARRPSSHRAAEPES